MNKELVQAKIVDSYHDSFDKEGPGAIYFLPHYQSAFVNCPGCGQSCLMNLKPCPSPSWGWNGNKEKPTFTPSINCIGCCGWHGHLTDGVFKHV